MYRCQHLYRFDDKWLNLEGKLLGEIVPTGEVPTFAEEVGQMGYQDRVKSTKTLFSVA